MDDTPLDTSCHRQYWQRCLRSLLPHQYTSNDSTRMTLGCFIVAAIDLLSASSTSSSTASTASTTASLSADDRRRFRHWVLACQHPSGGFAGSPTHVPPAAAYDSFDAATGLSAVGASGTANLAATLFALQLLVLLADEGSTDAFSGVHRAATLRWLQRLQRPDGSFGEGSAVVIDVSGHLQPLVTGGADMRYCYMAAMVRWMLRGDVQSASPSWVPDVDVPALVRYLRQGQTYDGGFAESSTHESHAGYAFCAIAALALLARPATGPSHGAALFAQGIPDRAALDHWLAARRLVPPEGDDDDDCDDDDDVAALLDAPQPLDHRPQHIGYNGRGNKPADTCYAWWTVGTLANLADGAVVDRTLLAPSRRFLLDRMQHRIGGFAKVPGGPPDIYHSYLGLAALAIMGETGLKALDPALCISVDAVRKIEAARSSLLRGAGATGQGRRQAYVSMGQVAVERAVIS